MVEKARKLPPFYDICARVKGHAEQDIASVPREGCSGAAQRLTNGCVIFRA